MECKNALSSRQVQQFKRDEKNETGYRYTMDLPATDGPALPSVWTKLRNGG